MITYFQTSVGKEYIYEDVLPISDSNEIILD
jgi:hypothetical protein